MNPLQRIDRYINFPVRFHRVEDWPAVLRQDPCVYCHAPAPSLDHIYPLALGGKNYWDNLAPACLTCNNRKGHTLLLMFLIGYQRADECHIPQLQQKTRQIVEKIPPMLTYKLGDLYES